MMALPPGFRIRAISLITFVCKWQSGCKTESLNREKVRAERDELFCRVVLLYTGPLGGVRLKLEDVLMVERWKFHEGEAKRGGSGCRIFLWVSTRRL